MTTTDLQKPFTDEELRDWAKTGGFMQSRVAKRLAARIIELEAENKRLREGLNEIITAKEQQWEDMVDTNPDMHTIGAFDGLVVASDIARTALKGGEI